MSEKEEQLPASMPFEEEAYAWVVRLSSDQRTRQDDADFEQWLGADEQNAARFEEGLGLWDALGSLKSDPEARQALGHLYTSSIAQDLEPSEQRLSRRAMLGGLGALAATLAGVLVLPKVLTGGLATFETAKGEQRRVVLADGSTVMLDTATRIEVAMEEGQRLIRLERGQAFFDVAHDPARPFRVFAGADEIRALGTAFEVRFEGGAARVILEEGQVAVFRGGARVQKLSAPASLKSPRKPDLVLQPGQETRLTQTELVKVVPVDLARTNAWRDGQMVFDDVSLATAVAEVNRYGGREVVLGDPSLGELRVSGTFHTNRPETFVEGVTAALPVRLQQSDSTKLVLTKI